MSWPDMNPFDRAALPAQLVLAGGCPGSGLTLLSLMLDAHPAIVCGPDTQLFCHPQAWQGGYSLQESLAPVFSGRAAVEPAQLGWCLPDAGRIGWYLTSLAELRSVASELTDVVALSGYLHAARRVVERKDLVVDVSPGNLFTMAVALSRYPQMKVLVCVRDGRATMLSRLKQRVGVVAAAAQWVAGAGTALSLVRRFGEQRVHVVRFEALLDRPLEVLDALCDFLGVATQSSRMLERAMTLRRTTDPTVAPGQARFAKWAARPTDALDPAAGAQWRSGLAQRYIQKLAHTQLQPMALRPYGLVPDVCTGRELMAEFGYALDAKDLSPPVLQPRELLPGSTAAERFFTGLVVSDAPEATAAKGARA